MLTTRAPESERCKDFGDIDCGRTIVGAPKDTGIVQDEVLHDSSANDVDLKGTAAV